MEAGKEEITRLNRNSSASGGRRGSSRSDAGEELLAGPPRDESFTGRYLAARSRGTNVDVSAVAGVRKRSTFHATGDAGLGGEGGGYRRAAEILTLSSHVASAWRFSTATWKRRVLGMRTFAA